MRMYIFAFHLALGNLNTVVGLIVRYGEVYINVERDVH